MTLRELFTAERSVHVQWLQGLIFPSVVGAALGLTMEFFGLLKLDPRSALELLRSWGPNFFIGMLIAVILGGLMSQVIDISRDGVSAQRQMAEAISKIAEKDDRQLQEIQTLQAYTAQQSDRLHRRYGQMSRTLQLIAGRMRISVEEMDTEDRNSGRDEA